MNWKFRAWLLRRMASGRGGRVLYQSLQNVAGDHLKPAFVRNRLQTQRDLGRLILDHGGKLNGARVVEVGTGWTPIVPLGFWMCGAESIDSYDITRQLSPNVLRRTVRWMLDTCDEHIEAWRSFEQVDRLAGRFTLMEQCVDEPLRLLEAARIRYHAPADASRTTLPDASIDVHYSVSVFEHVERDSLRAILTEAARILEPGGFSVHRIDPSDHFAHGDPRITHINFLQFDGPRWEAIAGHRLAYHNRLRTSDFLHLFEESPVQAVTCNSIVDERALARVRNGFPLSEPYRAYDAQDLCRERLDVVAQRPG